MPQSRQVVRIGPFKDFIASGVKVGDTIHLSGQVSIDATGAVVGVGDLAAQVHQAYANVSEVLAEFGATMADIVDEMWLVTDAPALMANANELFRIRAKAYGANPDVTQTTVQVAALVIPELEIEIRCIARV